MATATAELPVIRLINQATGVTFDYCGRWLRPGKATMADVKRGWARYPGDKVYLSFPPGVQKQLDAGRLQVLGQYEAKESVAAGQTAEALMPRGNASHDEWLTFAVSQGMDRQDAAGLTRDQIRARFTAPKFDPEAAPEEIGAEFELLNGKP